jgi:hypothetical protein
LELLLDLLIRYQDKIASLQNIEIEEVEEIKMKLEDI